MFRCNQCVSRWKTYEDMVRVAKLIEKINQNNESRLHIEVKKGFAHTAPQFWAAYKERSKAEVMAVLDRSLDRAPWWWNWEWDEIRFARRFLKEGVHVE